MRSVHTSVFRINESCEKSRDLEIIGPVYAGQKKYVYMYFMCLYIVYILRASPLAAGPPPCRTRASLLCGLRKFVAGAGAAAGAGAWRWRILWISIEMNSMDSMELSGGFYDCL